MTKNVALNTTETTLLAPTGTESFKVFSVLFCNTDSVTRLINLYMYPTGGSTSTGPVLLEYPIPAKETYLFDASILLNTGEKLTATAEVNTVIKATVSYFSL